MRNLVLRILLLAGCCLVVFSPTADGQEWREKIVPLESKVEDVSQMFPDSEVETFEKTVFHKLKDGNLLVDFSLGVCSGSPWGFWKVEKYTIVSFTFYPRRSKRPAYFGLKTEGKKLTNASGHNVYTDTTTGIQFSTQFGRVISIRVFPPSDKQYLKCEQESVVDETEIS